MRKDYKSDSIVIKLTGGDANAGNGGNGYNYGNIINKPTMTIDTYNKAEGSDVYTNTGDKVYQKASWEAEVGKAYSKGHDKYKGHDKHKAHDTYGGGAESNGDQESEHNGYNKSGDVYADTTATQTNTVMADQSIHVWAGVAGDGGDHAKAYGGDVDIGFGSV
jgi:hypothetical protein